MSIIKNLSIQQKKMLIAIMKANNVNSKKIKQKGNDIVTDTKIMEVLIQMLVTRKDINNVVSFIVNKVGYEYHKRTGKYYLIEYDDNGNEKERRLSHPFKAGGCYGEIYIRNGEEPKVHF